MKGIAFGVVLLFCLPGLSTVVEIKDVAVTAMSGYWVSDWREVEIPTNALSFQIVVLGSPDTRVQITDLIASDGQALVKSSANSPAPLSPYDFPVLANVLSPNRSEGVVPGTGSLNVPNHPGIVTKLSGRWRFRSLSHFEPSEKRVSFYIQTVDNHLARKVLEARFWIAPNSYWDQATAQIPRLLLEAKRIFARELGVKLRVRAISHLAGLGPGPIADAQGTADLARKQNDPDVINVYLLPKMVSQSKPINGLACLQGPAIRGLRHSCFVSLYADSERAEDISMSARAKILVHEFGHYLNLFHPMDEGYPKIGSVTDGLVDTPKNLVGENFMDPGIHQASPKFSPSQVQLLLASPSLRPE